MIHLSNISISLEFISFIKWTVITTHEGFPIEPSIAVYLDTNNNPALPPVIYLPEESPNAKLLIEAKNQGIL